jgi:protein-tyrosine phosphatase
MSEIIPGKLYLGSLKQAKDMALMKQIGVTAIISCGTFTNQSLPHPQIKRHVEIRGLKDNHRTKISLKFKECHEFIKEHKGAVFVHCLKGMSRSATIICSYLLLEGICDSVEEAVKLVQSKHTRAYPNPSFRAQLQ